MQLLTELRNGHRPCVWYQTQSAFGETQPQPCGAILSGSFNPLHDGHRQLAQSAADFLGHAVGFEISIHNVEKPPLELETIVSRCEQFETHPVALTNAPTFVEKAAILPGKTFIVGADTALRIVDARFYGDQTHDMLRALDAVRWNGCQFIVAGRKIGDRFVTIDDLEIPASVEDLFHEFPVDRFRVDVSSTDLRKGETQT